MTRIYGGLRIGRRLYVGARFNPSVHLPVWAIVTALPLAIVWALWSPTVAVVLWLVFVLPVCIIGGLVAKYGGR